MSRSDDQQMHANTRKALPSFDLLTPRQRQVADLLARGTPTRAIAEALGIGRQAVKNHASAIYRSLGLAPGDAPRDGQARPSLALLYVDLEKERARNGGYATGYRHGYVDGLERGRMEGRKAAIKEIGERCSVCPVR